MEAGFIRQISRQVLAVTLLICALAVIPAFAQGPGGAPQPNLYQQLLILIANAIAQAFLALPTILLAAWVLFRVMSGDGIFGKLSLKKKQDIADISARKASSFGD